jgi:hypothetical protein
LGTKLSFSTFYHPQTGDQTERVNQILEDMLQACVLSYGAKWEDCLPFAEFSYNNSYQAICRWPPSKPYIATSAVVGVLDTGVSRSTCSWAPSMAQLRPTGGTMTEASGEDPHEEASHEENDDQNC